MESLELLILQNLVYNPEYYQKVIPYITPEIFPDHPYRVLAGLIKSNYNKEKEVLTPELLKSRLDQCSRLNAQQYKEAELVYQKVIQKPEMDQPMATLLDVTQNHIRRCLIEKGLADISIDFENNAHCKVSGEAIKKLQDGTNFTFDQGNYYNYLGEFDERLEEYSKKADKFPFPIKALNDCTNGGMNRKSLSIVMASTGGGKSIFLCNAAAFLASKGYNVLYITCEMSVQEISKRIDANILDVTQDSITSVKEGTSALKLRMERVKDIDKWGKLFIKEYPAGYATAGIITRDLEEIEHSKETKIDVLIVDYLNLLTTDRYSTKNANTYVLVKAVAEELRGIGQTFDIPVLSATQSNRSALNKDTMIDAGMAAVSDSYGLPQTADFMFNIIAPEEWKKEHFRLFKILKNRWGDPNKEFIKVHLRTDFARFKDVDGWEKAATEKPVELVKAFADNSGVSFKDDKKKVEDKSGI